MMGYGCVIDGMEMSSYEPVKNPLWTRNRSHLSRTLAQSSIQEHQAHFFDERISRKSENKCCSCDQSRRISAMSRSSNSRCIEDWFSSDCFCFFSGRGLSQMTSPRCFSIGRTNHSLLPQNTPNAISNMAPAITRYDAHMGSHCSSQAAKAIAKKISPTTTIAVIANSAIISPNSWLVFSILRTCSSWYCVFRYAWVSDSNWL